LSGGALLARRESIGREWRLQGAATGPQFRAEVLRVTHAMQRAGARLGVCVALTACEKAWPGEREEHAARRAAEAALGLPPWGQQLPAATAHKVVVMAPVWSALRSGLERACDGPSAVERSSRDGPPQETFSDV
jgi:hypothetical protein